MNGDYKMPGQFRINVNNQKPVELLSWRWLDPEEPNQVMWEVRCVETDEVYDLKNRKIGRLVPAMEVIAWAAS